MFRNQTSVFVNVNKKIYVRGKKYSWNIQANSRESGGCSGSWFPPQN